MIHTLDKELTKYRKLLDAEQKKSIITLIKSFVHPETKGSRTTVKQYNKELDEAMARIENGDFVKHEDILKEMGKW